VANSLLDFVISLVRDPDAAARYAANPAQSIADAHLGDVTSVDVNNLIPMVSDSLSMAGPSGAVSGAPVDGHGNVWASGAAAAALDAFSPHTPAGVLPPHGAPGGVIDQPSTPVPDATTSGPRPIGFESHEPSVLLNGAQSPDVPVDHGGLPGDELSLWDHSVADHPHTVQPDHHDFGVHG
jgi:hypothetical protein